MDLGAFVDTFSTCFTQADFVKIVLSPTWEPQSGESGDSDSLLFSISFGMSFRDLSCVTLHRFVITLGPLLGPIWDTCWVIFWMTF